MTKRVHFLNITTGVSWRPQQWKLFWVKNVHSGLPNLQDHVDAAKVGEMPPGPQKCGHVAH
jgi:hypothetical protein